MGFSLKTWLKVALIALSHKDEYKYHFDKLLDLRRQVEAEKQEIIALYERMKAEYRE